MASDTELYRRMRSGDEDAFTALYRRYQAAIYRFALQMSGSEAVAEDVVQEVFLNFIRRRDAYDPERGALAAYLYGVARRQVLRSIGKTRELPQPDDFDAPAGGGDALADLAHGETLDRLRDAVVALPEHYREVLVLCDLEEMSYADAASALECPEGTIRSRLHRARAMLAERLRGRTKPGPQRSSAAPGRCFA